MDPTGVYVTGSTASTDFPGVSGSSIQPANGGGSSDAFITKLDLTLSSTLYSTYLGGGQADIGESIAVDAVGNAYVTGETSSTPLTTAVPTNVGPQSTIGGAPDAFVSEINSAGSTLVFSTYLGGSGSENINGDLGAIAVDSQGTFIYVTGGTSSTNFPVSTLALQSTLAGSGTTDAFAVKYVQCTESTITAST